MFGGSVQFGRYMFGGAVQQLSRISFPARKNKHAIKSGRGICHAEDVAHGRRGYHDVVEVSSSTLRGTYE